MREGWNSYKIEELGRIVTGKTPSTQNPDNFGDKYPFVTPRDMSGQKKIERTERYLSDHDINKRSRLRAAIDRLNPDIPADAREEACKRTMRAVFITLIDNNEAFHRLLTDGVDVKYSIGEGKSKTDKVWLIDFANPENNEFLAVNQFTVLENHNTKRPDVVLFINGLPLVVVELKNPLMRALMRRRRSTSCKPTSNSSRLCLPATLFWSSVTAGSPRLALSPAITPASWSGKAPTARTLWIPKNNPNWNQ